MMIQSFKDRLIRIFKRAQRRHKFERRGVFVLRNVGMYEKYHQKILMSAGCYYRHMELCTIFGTLMMLAHTWSTCRCQHILGICKTKVRKVGRPKGSGIIVPIQKCIYLGLLKGRWIINGRKKKVSLFFS